MSNIRDLHDLRRGAASSAPSIPPAGDIAAQASSMKIGELLIANGLVTKRDVANALAMQREAGILIGQALLRLGTLVEEALLENLSMQLDLPVMDEASLPNALLSQNDIFTDLGLRNSWFSSRRAAGWFEASADGDTKTLVIIAANPLDQHLRETIESSVFRYNDENDAFIKSVKYCLVMTQALDWAIARQHQSALDEADYEDLTDAARLRELAEEAPVIEFVNNVFALALKENSSDIHLEAFEHSFRVRFRIDGVLRTRQTQSRSLFDAVSSRVKLLAGMDIAERRLPQDGRHTIRFGGNEIDLRVSSVPSIWGESLVIRLLRKKDDLPDIEGLGLMGQPRTVLEELLAQPNGIILVTGPTGSGKSTTLYRSLERLNDGVRKIITIEDPVEYDVAGVTQIQVKPDIGYDFASGLRAILRQDPDIIMVGEIRDGETARISSQAALTGHLVLSTLHTNSALAAVTRLTDIGLEPFLIGDSVRGLVAQRLVRKLCSHCSLAAGEPAAEQTLAERVSQGAQIATAMAEPANWRKAAGCDRCEGTGYSGRVGIYEAAKIDDDLRECILSRGSIASLFECARRQGFTTLYEDALVKARAGITTVVEATRVCGADADIPGHG